MRSVTLAVVLITLVLVGVGVGVWVLLGPVRQTHGAQDWPETVCTVQGSKVHRRKDDEGHVSYRIQIRYSYEVAGRLYQSSRYSFFGDPRVSDEEQARYRAFEWRAGVRATCYYDPNDPSEAVLDRDYPISGWLLVLMLVPVVIIGGSVLAYRIQARRARDAEEPRERWDRIDLPDGSMVLTPRRRMAARLLVAGATAFASVSSLAVWARVMFGPLGSPQPIVAILGAVVLGAVAVIGTGWLGYTILRAISPRLRLALSHHPLRLGARCRLGWRLRGRVGAVRELRIALVCAEEVAGKSARSGERVLCTQRRAEDIRAGSVEVELPAHAMHTFHGRNHRVLWLVHLAGDVARWPDIDEEFELEVLPPEERP